MKLKSTQGFFLFFFSLLLTSQIALAQCSLSFTTQTRESRCKATGQIIVTASGGSGNYNYKVTKGSFTSVTSTNTISGLEAGLYIVEVKDLVTGCSVAQTNVAVSGNYQDPRFQLNVTDVTCINGNNGTVSVSSVQYGRGPFTYTIVAPSASSVGASNTSGTFTNLTAGDYYVRMTDSCGGIQTRAITVSNYNWLFDSRTVTEVGCDSADVAIVLKDSRNNYNTSGTTFNGFTYGVTRAPGDTTWFSSRSFRFFKGTYRTVTFVAKDPCGNIKTSNWTDNTIPSIGASVSISSYACAGFTATVTGQTNLTNPQYCLYTNANVLVSCNSTGVFTSVPYGSYCVRVTDNCYDTTIQRCFTVNQPVPNVAASVSISSLACAGFTATVTGQTNLTSPQYCLYTNTNVLVSCNTTGVFTNVPYGSYCIQITDGCTGTVINRCFTQNRPVPSLGPSVSITNRTCNSFTASIGGQSNINNGQYCIYDNNGVVVACNSTGVFNNLPYGTYCLRLQNDVACYDTIISRCFTATQPVPSVSGVSASSQTCTGFTATVTGQTNLTNPQFCLYDINNNLVSCNTNGQFTGLAYGSYCVRITNDASCYDTVIQRCFTVNRPVPSVGASVSISSKVCSGFTATITGQSNLTSPQYCLYNSSNVQVACNSTGVFTNVPYGSYCINIVNTCYDTTIVRCFTVNPTAMALNISAIASCTIGTTDFNASWTATSSPYTLQVYNPGGVLVKTSNAASNSTTITGLTALPAGLKYKVVITDNCGNKDSTQVTPNASWLNKSVNANSKCPSGQWQNGSGDLSVFCQYSNGTATPKIIKKDGTTVNISHNYSSGNNFSFTNMEPATYIIEYSLQGCSSKVYDTFALQPYSFPSLQQSGVYQCNNASFGVNAVVTGGLAPFSYEIIGSMPETPSIITSQQSSPAFNLNNGNSYSVVRLRSIDACGNATINDASILPLANVLVTATSNCFYNNITLNVDTIPNATYTWYKKTSSVDSSLIATSQSYNIPYLLPSDTGVYICKVSVNAGCLTRLSYFNLNGSCTAFLSANDFSVSGSRQQQSVQLEWNTTSGFDASQFMVERSADGRQYQAIGTVKATRSSNNTRLTYLFSDNDPLDGTGYYRIRIVKKNGEHSYSKVLSFQFSRAGLKVLPNPVADRFQVKFDGMKAGRYTMSLMSVDGKLILHETLQIGAGESRWFQRPAQARPGSYLLVVQPADGGQRFVNQLILR